VVYVAKERIKVKLTLEQAMTKNRIYTAREMELQKKEIKTKEKERKKRKRERK